MVWYIYLQGKLFSSIVYFNQYIFLMKNFKYRAEHINVINLCVVNSRTTDSYDEAISTITSENDWALKNT